MTEDKDKRRQNLFHKNQKKFDISEEDKFLSMKKKNKKKELEEIEEEELWEEWQKEHRY